MKDSGKGSDSIYFIEEGEGRVGTTKATFFIRVAQKFVKNYENKIKIIVTKSSIDSRSH